MRKLLASFICAALLAGTASAASFQNGSFETGTFSANRSEGDSRANHDQLFVGSSAISGWTVIGTGDISWEQDKAPGTFASDGGYSLDLSGYYDAAPYAGVTQTFDTIAGHIYQLSFDVGASNAYTRGSATVEARINGTSLFSMSNPNSLGDHSWVTGSGQFTAAGSSTTLDLMGRDGSLYIGLDNVRLLDISGPIAAAPEPTSWAMMIAGFGIVGGSLRRRTKQTASAALA